MLAARKKTFDFLKSAGPFVLIFGLGLYYLIGLIFEILASQLMGTHHDHEWFYYRLWICGTGVFFFLSGWLIIKKNRWSTLLISTSLICASMISCKSWINYHSNYGGGLSVEFVTVMCLIGMIYIWWSYRRKTFRSSVMGSKTEGSLPLHLS